MGDTAVTPNDALAFLIELAALVLLGMWGWQRDASTLVRWSFAVGAPAVAAMLWGLFAAPRSRFDVVALEIGTKTLVLGAAVLAARTIMAPGWWWVFAALVVVNTILLYVGPSAR